MSSRGIISLTAFVLAAWFSVPTCAADISSVLVRQDAVFVHIRGEIVAGDANKFRVVVGNFNVGMVLLESPGGALLEGLEIGRIIQSKRFATGIAPYSECASACSLIWLAGAGRYVSRHSKIGFHAASMRGSTEASGPGNALIGAYVASLGLSSGAIVYITSALPQQMIWMTPSEAERLGIRLNILEVEQPEPSVEPRSSSGYLYVTGLDPQGDNWLAFKEGPDIKSRRIDKLDSGTKMTSLGRSGDWIQVRLENGRTGWVHSRYVGCCIR